MAHGSVVDEERRPDGTIERALTVFLAGSECPFTCSFCDLWRWTTDGPTPAGALPKQLSSVLQSLAHPLPWPARLKLYNASNFFDRRAVPADDVPVLAALAQPFAGVTVESHANTIGPLTLEFARAIPGRLEVAVGLETIHPEATRHLNKRLDLARFDRAARFLADNNIDLRVFVLLGAPYVPSDESVDWAVRTAEYAAQRGAAVVSLIPVRGGNGEMERLLAEGNFTPPTLAQLEAALDRLSAFGHRPSALGAQDSTVFTADLWDVGLLPACAHCRDERVARLKRLNVTGRVEAPIVCGAVCHPEPLACHPEPLACHPERSEGSAVARGRLREGSAVVRDRIPRDL